LLSAPLLKIACFVSSCATSPASSRRFQGENLSFKILRRFQSMAANLKKHFRCFSAHGSGWNSPDKIQVFGFTPIPNHGIEA
jgi:hypothetical protein